MTETEKIVDKFVRSISGQRYRQIFDILESNGLSPLGATNNNTLLFQLQRTNGEVWDILHFAWDRLR